MHKQIVIILILLLAPIYIKADDKKGKNEGEWSIGIGGGPTFSNIDYESRPKTDTKTISQLFGGVSVRYLSEKNLGVIAEINYMQQGWETDFEDLPQNEGFKHQHKLNYIDIPIMTHIYFGNKVRFFVNLGPKIGFLLSESETISDELVAYLASGNVPQNTNLGQYYRKADKKIDYGILGGLGLEFQTGIGSFSIEGRYNFSFGDIYKNGRTDHYNRSANRVMSAKITYYIKAF